MHHYRFVNATFFCYEFTQSWVESLTFSTHTTVNWKHHVAKGSLFNLHDSLVIATLFFLFRWLHDIAIRMNSSIVVHLGQLPLLSLHSESSCLNGQPCFVGFNSGTMLNIGWTCTAQHLSDKNFAVKSLTSLWRILINYPFLQDILCWIEHIDPEAHVVGKFAISQPYRNLFDPPYHVCNDNSTYLVREQSRPPVIAGKNSCWIACSNGSSNSLISGMVQMKHATLLLKPLTNDAYAGCGLFLLFLTKVVVDCLN